jgi:Domain of unknown function (DUF222)/HNH endonuclease
LTGERLFDSVVVVGSELFTLELAVDQVRSLDLANMGPERVGRVAIEVGLHIDRMKALHALIVVEADRARSWYASGARNVADWLATETGTSHGEAQSRVKLGDTLERSPELKAAVDAGEVSASSAEVLHDAIANPPDGTDADDINDLIDAAKGAGPRDTRAAAEAWKHQHATESEEERTRRRYAKRSVTSGPAQDGLITTTVILPELESRQFHNSLDHLIGPPVDDDDRTTAQKRADALIELSKAYNTGAVTGGREKPTIIITCTEDTIAGVSDEPGWTGHGDRIPADVVRHLAENALLRRIILAGSVILDLGTTTRLATDNQFQALIVRDGGCRWPGCHIPAAWCEADHLIPFTEGGPTDLDNLVLWCSHHHHVKHRPGVVVHGDAHDLKIELPDGTMLACPPRGRTGRASRSTQAAA